MSTAHSHAHGVAEQEATQKTTLGFWIYLMTDCLLFASLFATYAVLQGNTFGGPGPKELFSLPYVLIETLILLASSYTAGLAVLALHRNNVAQVKLWLGITFLLGLAFLGMELNEFTHMVREGHDWRTSGFLSAFFTLVGTHGAHITVGLIWILVMLRNVSRRGITAVTGKRLMLWSLFWHFLDIVWIFIFTMVFLLGVS